MIDQETDPLVDAAVSRFAHDGFGAPLREVAQDAGVSAALLVKRFGSKEGLRAVCDEHVLQSIRHTKAESIHAAAEHRPLWALPTQDEHAVLTGYLLRSVLDGGEFGRTFVEHMIDDAEEYIADAVGRGLVRPSRDERARARYMVQSGIGSLLVSMLLAPQHRWADLGHMLRRLQEETALPSVELYTEGFFTDDTVLRNMGRHLSGTPEEPFSSETAPTTNS